MPSVLQMLGKEVDIDFLVFVERYATDLLRWDILTFFAHNPDFYVPISKVARHVNCSSHSIRPELSDFALLGILSQKQTLEGQLLYQLADVPRTKKLVLKFIR